MVLINFLLALLFSISAQASALKTLTANEYYLRNPSSERKAIVNFLIHQFDDKRKKGVTQTDLDKLWQTDDIKQKYQMARFQIVNQQVYADCYYAGHYYFPMLTKYFQKLVKKYKINDVDFIIYLREEIPINEKLGEKTLGTPAFMMFQDQNSIYEKDKLLFPDAFFLKETNKFSWAKLIDKIIKARSEYPWNNKIEKIFWRGATTGDFYYYTVDNFDKLPRVTITMLSELYPDLVDAKFAHYSYQILEEEKGSLKDLFDILFPTSPENVTESNHLKYKYLLSVDGNSATNTRVAWIMLSNSLLLKQDSEKIQWYYSALKPYFNYVPVNHDLSSLFEQLTWAKQHDEELKKISQNAQNFIENNLMPEDIDSHIILLLNEYSSLQKDSKIKVTLPKAKDYITTKDLIKSLFKRFIDKLKWWFSS